MLGGSGKVDWWDYVHYRNYKLWNNTLTKEEVTTSMLK